MALNFPNSPSIGDEFTGGGFTWVWDGNVWEKVSSSINGNWFDLSVGSSGNTTFDLEKLQVAGTYTITSKLNDSSYDVYLINSANENVGYSNTSTITASKSFNKVVVYGATNNDILAFVLKPTATPSTSGTLEDGAAPFLTSASPATLESIDDTTTVTGGNFATDVEVKFVGTDAVDRPAKSIVRSSSTQLIVTRPDTFPVSAEPFSMVATNPGITNPTGTNANRLNNYFDAGGGITWVTASGALPNYTFGSAYSTTLSATDADGLAVTYSIVSGSLPSGMSLNSSTGVISGTENSSWSSSFTVRATDTGGNTADRAFTLGASLSANYLIVAGGGGGGAHGNGTCGGGGAGGMLDGTTSLSQGTYTITVGAGASGIDDLDIWGNNGSNSSAFGLTSIGGGGGGAPRSSPDYRNGRSGGSGGGAANSQGRVGGNGTSGQGFKGGDWTDGGAGGGGGAAEAGDTDGFRQGGDGKVWSVNGITYAGGGGAFEGVAGDGGGGAGASNSGPGTSGLANRGGGGGGAGFSMNGSSGGSGIVIFRYPSSAPDPVSTTGSPTVTNTGGFKTYTFTGSGSVTF